MANRDLRINRLIVDFISGSLGFIGIGDVLKYDSDKDFSDPLSIPNVGYVQSLIGGGGTSTVIHRSFTIPESDIVDGIVSLVGRTNDQGDQIIPAKSTWAVETEDGSVGRYINATQTVDGLGSGGIEVYLVGVEAVEPTGLALQNTTDKILKYSINSFVPLDLAIGDSITVSPGDSVLLYLDSSSEIEYQLWDQSGPIVNTDGLYLIDAIPHEWVIPINSVELVITQPF